MKTSGSLFSNYETLKIENESLRSTLNENADLLKTYEQQISWLTEQLNTLKRGKFGSKSERWESEEQMLLLNEAELESQNPDIDEDDKEEEIKVQGHVKARGHRRALPEHLEREVIKLELPEEERVDESGTPLKVIGWEISEKLKYEPAKMSVLQYHRAKYGVESGDYVKTTPPVASIIPKGLATPELLAAIITAKYADGLPLYRMESIFGRQDVELSRGTMARWVVQVAKALEPIKNVLVDGFFECGYVACDETSVQVLKEDGRKAEGKSWMIVRSTPMAEKKIILFDYSVSRSQETMKDLFAGYEGVLQTDGLNSYKNLALEKIICIGCNMHARRRFEEAAKEGAKSGKSLAEVGLKFYQKIYDLEKELKGKSEEEIKKARDEIARPLFTETKSWIELNIKKVPDKSKIGEAFRYFLNQYESLTGYLQRGDLNPDNGFTERAIRKFAIGRNNWMFSDTVAGADASSLLYSLVVTAKFNGVNVYRAFTKILTDLPLAKTYEDYERLAEIILTSSTET